MVLCPRPLQPHGVLLHLPTLFAFTSHDRGDISVSLSSYFRLLGCYSIRPRGAPTQRSPTPPPPPLSTTTSPTAPTVQPLCTMTLAAASQQFPSAPQEDARQRSPCFLIPSHILDACMLTIHSVIGLPYESQ